MKKKILKFLLFLLFVFAYACEPEETCETETICNTWPDGTKSCIEKPVPNSCFNNGFGI